MALWRREGHFVERVSTMGCGGSTARDAGGVGGSAGSLEAASKKGLESLLTFLRSGGSIPAAEELREIANDVSAARWLKAVHSGISVVWEPLITAVEQRISSKSDGSASWDSLTTVDLLKFLVEATGGNPAGVCEATTALLAAGHGLWQRQRRLSLAGAPKAAEAEAAFPSGPLCRLLGLLGVALCRSVAVEDPVGLSRRLTPWNNLRTAFGLDPTPHLCSLLDGSSKGLLVYCSMTSLGDARLKLDLSRERALWDAIAPWEGSPFGEEDCEARSCKLFPRFHGEAGEGHGPRKEFFALVGQQLLHGGGPGAGGGSASSVGAGAGGGGGLDVHVGSPAPLLPHVAASRQHWFDDNAKRTSESERLCRFSGWLLGQTLCNRAPLQVSSFPPLLFRCLLGVDSKGALPDASMALLEEFDGAAAANLRKVTSLKDADFAAMCELEELDAAVTSRERYIEVACRRLLLEGDMGGVRWQLGALVGGFRQALPPDVLAECAFSPLQLAEAVSGASDGGVDAPFQITDAFRIAKAAGEFEGAGPLLESLWRVLEAWPPREKRRFVRFVTGTERLPPAGSEVITIQSPMVDDDDYGGGGGAGGGRAGGGGGGASSHLLGMLPQAHTCDNVLELPNYWEALCAKAGESPTALAHDSKDAKRLIKELEAIVHERLSLAVNECDVYGLDETNDVGVRGGDGGMSRGTHAAQRAPASTRTRETSSPLIPALRGSAAAQPPPPPQPQHGATPRESPRVSAQSHAAAAALTSEEDDDDEMLESLLLGAGNAMQSSAASAKKQPPSSTTVTGAPRHPLGVRDANTGRSSGGGGVRGAPPTNDEDMMSEIATLGGVRDDVGADNVDDLITELGVSSHEASPVQRRSMQRPGALNLEADRTTGAPNVDSRMTASDIDLDLEIEALEL